MSCRDLIYHHSNLVSCGTFIHHHYSRLVSCRTGIHHHSRLCLVGPSYTTTAGGYLVELSYTALRVFHILSQQAGVFYTHIPPHQAGVLHVFYTPPQQADVSHVFHTPHSDQVSCTFFSHHHNTLTFLSLSYTTTIGWWRFARYSFASSPADQRVFIARDDSDTRKKPAM